LSTLADRVRAIVTPPAVLKSSADAAAVPEHADLGAVERLASRTASLLGGEWRDECCVIERRWTSSARHGRDSVRGLADRLTSAAADAPFFAGGAPASAPFLFFDLETTGLSGGAGTYVFLIGTGGFEGDEFVTRQFLMTRHTDERPMLRTVATHCSSAGTLVSFNGKSFDAPVLETRYSFHRMPWFADQLPHIDVLHPARQFWKRDDCSLGALEHHVLGHRRTGDVHGYEVPARYFQFLRTGDIRPLTTVLEHNRLDLLSLAGLTGRLLHLAKCGPGEVRDSREALALGHVYARAGMDDKARDAYSRSIALSRAPRGAFDATRIEALRALALAWRRTRQFAAAAACWQELLAVRGCPPAIAREAAEALAIHSEHRLRDFAGARAYVSERFDDWPAGRKREAIAYRLQRLNRKLQVEANRQTPLLDW
jgi:uncharacterized protein YprB with RNaseH-like and TPR domain